MFTAMPAPVQVYYGIGGETSETCPLTVREGRSFLSQFFADRDPATLIQELEDSDRHKTEEELENAPLIVSLKDVWFRYEKDAPDVLRGASTWIYRRAVSLQ